MLRPGEVPGRVETIPGSSIPVDTKIPANHEKNPLPDSATEARNPVKSCTILGSRITNAEPRRAPETVPIPPMSRMATNWIDMNKENPSGTRRPTKAPRIAPVNPANPEERANAISLFFASATPITSAAMSRSRIAMNARPVLVRWMFFVMITAMITKTSSRRYVFASLVTLIPNHDPSVVKSRNGTSSFQKRNCNEGNSRPAWAPPVMKGVLRKTHSPKKTNPSVTIAR